MATQRCYMVLIGCNKLPYLIHSVANTVDQLLSELREQCQHPFTETGNFLDIPSGTKLANGKIVGEDDEDEETVDHDFTLDSESVPTDGYPHVESTDENKLYRYRLFVLKLDDWTKMYVNCWHDCPCRSDVYIITSPYEKDNIDKMLKPILATVV